MEKEIGSIDVDAGLCWVGDPCYILHRELPATLGKTWSEFCDLIKDPHTHTSFKHRPHGCDGLGVCVSTGYGDGTYPVFADIGEDGRVKSIKIVFVSDEDEEEETWICGECDNEIGEHEVLCEDCASHS